MINKNDPHLARILYLPHGGGPLPLLGDKHHQEMVTFLKEIVHRLVKPSAIVLISAHWEEDSPTITSHIQPGLLYDYYGFPAESYKIQYAAPGHPGLAEQVCKLISDGNYPAKLDGSRDFDHGMFVPLKLMYPQADIPCIQLSLLKDLDPRHHIEMGKSIASLRRKNVVIIGSGMSFHNIRAFFSPEMITDHQDVKFDNWLNETCAHPDLNQSEREERLMDWENAPHARFCHPREEHLLPLHVCFGAACAVTPMAKTIFNSKIMGMKVSGILW